MVREVYSMLKKDSVIPGNILREFVLEFDILRSVPIDVVWRILHFHVKTKMSYTQESKFGVKTELDPIDRSRLA